MFSKVFLAVTAGELESVRPKRIAYMSCHFSAGGLGLSNMPQSLPEGSILLLDDSMPVQGHDSKTVVQQLNALAEKFSICAVLLDFQRPPTKESRDMVSAIQKNCRCKVAVTPAHAAEDHGVFLPSPPPDKSLSDHLKPWANRDVFMELYSEGTEITVTSEGCRFTPAFPTSPLPLADKRLHCHYAVTVSPGKAIFTLIRNREDLADLAQEAEALGILGTVGLYQELQ